MAPIGPIPFSDSQLLKQLKEKSNWRAPTGSLSLETFINKNKIKLTKVVPKIVHNQNMTKDEKRALKNLGNDKSITIKPADKGGTVVVMNTTDYIAEAHRQLNDPNTYSQLADNPTQTYTDQINNMIDDMIGDKGKEHLRQKGL